jgi:predicted metal-dependent hydrolase
MIAALPPELRDYVIVHELCHLAVFNHSPGFWAEVAKVIPNHHALRTKLRTHGRLLM